jgi:hypothetical protein
VDRWGPPSMPRRAGYPWTEQMARKMLRNVEKPGVHTAGNAPSEDGKCWQRVELSIHGLNRWLVKCIEMSRKRGVQAVRNGPSKDRKCWQRIELGIHSLKSWVRNWSRKVRETRSSSSQKRFEPAAHPCRGPGGQGGNEYGGSPWFQGGVEPGRAPAGEGRELLTPWVDERVRSLSHRGAV